jgi:hypothetical protein
MSKEHKRSNREVRKPKKTAAERSAAKLENSVSAVFLKEPKPFGKRKL